jgi:transposase InsO family protein
MQGHYSATQLKGILENYIETIMQHDHNKYPGVVNRWTIVNEATHLCGVFCQGLGKDASGYPAYVALAYRYTRKTDPTVQLCYDDWGGEGSGSAALTLRLQQKKFDRFRQDFNCERPHEGLNNATLGSVYQPSSVFLPRNPIEFIYPPGSIFRTVNNIGKRQVFHQRSFSI